MHQKEEESGINIKEIFNQAFNYWYFYLASVLICFILAWVYLRYTPSIYSVQTTILIKDDKNKLGPDAFIDGMELLASSKNVQNEIEIIRSYENIKKTVKDLNLEVSYYIEGNIKTGELYHTSPFIIKLDTSYNQTFDTPFYIRILSDSTFSIYPNNKEISNTDQTICEFGIPCQSSQYSLIVNKSDYFLNVNKSNNYYFIIHNDDKVTQQYLSKIKIELSDKKSSILVLSSNGLIPERERDFLNTLCKTYIQEGLNAKNQIAINTIRFIDDQLDEITDSLQGAEKRLEKFRSSEKLMDLSFSAENAFSQLEVLEKEQAELLVKNRYYNYLLEYVSYNYDIKEIIAPSAMGIQDPLLNNLIAELHNLNTEKTSLSFSTKEQNPTSHIIDLKIDNTKKSLIENLKNIIEASKMALQDNKNRLSRIQDIIDRLPANERNLVNIQRKFLLNEYIYNYLMQKRIEAGIAKAANLPDNRVINKAMLYGNNPVSPKRLFILLAAFVIGLILPSGWLYAKNMLNTTITAIEVIERYTNIPIIGSIAHNKSKVALPIVDYPKSSVSESIRSLRVNLQYLASNETNKVIGVTSSISGEGKTFFSANLAASIALSGAKVLIIGADLRKPKLNQMFDLDNTVGLSTYLIGKATIPDIIKVTPIKGLDIITSGPIPPNPMELLESIKTTELINMLRGKYEYIIIDAPPVGIVSDYYLLSKHIDADLFLIRQNYTQKDFMKEIEQISKSKKLRHMFLVFNDLVRSSAYGYHYGYNGYYEEKAKTSYSWITSLKSKLTLTKKNK